MTLPAPTEVGWIRTRVLKAAPHSGAKGRGNGRGHRVLEDGALERRASTKTLHVDVRVIAATNRDLRIWSPATGSARTSGRQEGSCERTQ